LPGLRSSAEDEALLSSTDPHHIGVTSGELMADGVQIGSALEDAEDDIDYED
tara:strand:- start:201 stop:356 length:156 start_codon:yes stop_codon:yes gene_type:complete